MLGEMEWRHGCTLALAAPEEADDGYPTGKLQKGWQLVRNGASLAREGVGFGTPMVRYGHRTVFPGQASASRSGPRRWEVEYSMDLVERLTTPGGATLAGESLYVMREWFCALHRKVPAWRGPLQKLFGAARSALRVNTTFVRLAPWGKIRVHYEVDEGGALHVRALFDLPARPSSVMMANEQGALSFDRYEDSDGLHLEGRAIGSWNKTPARRAYLSGRAGNIRFGASQVAAAQLYRGWEMEPGRLDWAGLSYVLPGSATEFSYDLRVEEA